MITIIAAIGANKELGKDNDLIWHLPADLKRFKKVTTGHAIIMGRNTFESIGKPLPNRRSIIITRNPSYKKEGCEVVHSLEDAIELIHDQDDAFIIGGAQIYNEAMEKNLNNMEVNLEETDKTKHKEGIENNRNHLNSLKGKSAREWREYATQCMIEILDNKKQ